MLIEAVERCDGPVSIRWPKTEARTIADHEVGVGLSARRAREGDNRLCLIGIGKMLEPCLEAADRLAADGIEATVWDPRVIKPLDEIMLDDAAGHHLIITVEDGLRQGGAGTGIRVALDDRGADSRVRVLGVPASYIPHAKPAAILARLGLDADGVVAEARRLLS